jgi:hypothetical protein
MNVQVVNVELLGLLFDFAPQHGVVGELDDSEFGEGPGQRQNRGGFPRTGDGIHNDIGADGFYIVDNKGLLGADRVH